MMWTNLLCEFYDKHPLITGYHSITAWRLILRSVFCFCIPTTICFVFKTWLATFSHKDSVGRDISNAWYGSLVFSYLMMKWGKTTKTCSQTMLQRSRNRYFLGLDKFVIQHQLLSWVQRLCYKPPTAFEISILTLFQTLITSGRYLTVSELNDIYKN